MDLKQPQKLKVVGHTQFVLRDVLARASGSRQHKMILLDEKNKLKGTLEISKFEARRFHTYFDLVFRN